MLDPQLVLSTGNRLSPAHKTTPRRALVVGAGGVLGSAVMEQLLASHRFVRVAAMVHRPVQAAVHGFVAVNTDADSLQALAADTALVVFDRVRQAFQREAAFVVPQPQQLPELAAQLLAAGVRHLIVVMPHRAALLPMALQQGLATLDEAAVSALGFDQLVFMRMAQGAASDVGVAGSWRDSPQRLAHWMLSQLRWMTPQREQPVQHATVAKVAAALAVQLPQATAATRVLPAQLLWHSAQQRQVHDTVRAWLAGVPLPPLPTQKRLRM